MHKRRIFLEFRQRRIHVIPGLSVRSPNIVSRTEPTGIIQAAGTDAYQIRRGIKLREDG
jgi:hypothetical protein